MPIVLGTFTFSSTKFIDCCIIAETLWKRFNHCLPRMHDEAHQHVVGGKLNNERSTLLFSPFSSFVSQNREYAHISQWTFKSWESLCVILPEFCSKIKPQKERWNFPFILARARSRLCRLLVINKLAPRWVKLSAEARTLMEGDIGWPNTAIP